VISASFAAGGAVEQPILAKTDAQLALAIAAILFARALGLRHFALQAKIDFGGAGARGHGLTLSPASQHEKVPEVTTKNQALGPMD
jgi:hypothetical protein